MLLCFCLTSLPGVSAETDAKRPEQRLQPSTQSSTRHGVGRIRRATNRETLNEPPQRGYPKALDGSGLSGSPLVDPPPGESSVHDVSPPPVVVACVLTGAHMSVIAQIAARTRSRDPLRMALF